MIYNHLPPAFDAPIRAAIAQRAAKPLPKGTQTIFVTWTIEPYEAYSTLHALAQESGWGNDYTIRIENNGLKAYKNTGK